MVTYQPNVDAIQEFKMITNNAPAEFGNYQGAIVNISIRSGTNSFHGTAFEFLRNDKLNANAWNRNWQGTNRESVRHNVFGGTVGGRIIRDKVFFFVDYEGTRRANPGAPDSVTLIPMDFRNGDLSRLLTERNTQLYDPLSTNSTGDRQPLPNNQIPAARIDPVARNLFSMPDVYPVPMNSALRFNALNTGSSYVYTDQGDIKIDAKPSSRDDFSARYSISKHDAPGRNTIPALLNTFFTSPFQAGVVNWTHTFGPSLVNELRAGVNRSIFNDGGDPGGVGNLAEELGIARGNERGPGLMLLAFQGGLSTNLGNQNNGALRINVNNTYHYADNLTVVRGRHMMKTGGQFLRVQSNVFYAGNNGRTGFMRYTGQYTSGPNANRPVSKGLAEADFILGYPTRLGRGVDSGLWGQRKIIVGSYFQDDWRVNAGLTLNLGLRWEYHSPLVEVADRQSNFEMLTGKLLLAGKDGASRGLYESYTRGWQPRVGFAWTPAFFGRNTVLRGAYTISSYMEGTGVNSRLPMNPPFVGEFEAIYEGQPQVASTSAQGLTVLKAQDPWKGATLRMWDPYVRPANSQQWSFFIERQLPGENFFSLGYVGQHGTHLMLFAPYFQRRLLPGGGTAPSPYVAGNPLLAQISRIQGEASEGNQRYDALQTTLRRRMGRGLEYQVSYTWSKGMTDSRGFYGEAGQAASQANARQYLYNRGAEWGPAYFSAAHMFNFNCAYDLPLGRGRAAGGNWNGAMQAIGGNWRLSGILALRSGFPLTITALDRSGTVSLGPRADRIGDGAGARDVGPGAAWFDTAAFRQPVAGTLGSSGVGVVRGPGLTNADVSFQKSVPVSEASRFELRIEFFNLANTPIFQAPVNAVSSATFGEIIGSQGERNIQIGLKFYF